MPLQATRAEPSRRDFPRTFWHLPCGRTSSDWSSLGIVAEDWDDNGHGGIIHNSVVVFDVRPGNPKNIHHVG